jgi:hypothetical protein
MQESPSDNEIRSVSPQDVISSQHAQIAALQASSIHKDALIAKSAGLISEWQAKHRELEQAYDKRLQDFIALSADRAVADRVIHDLENRVASLIKKIDQLDEKLAVESRQFATEKAELKSQVKSLGKEIDEMDVSILSRDSEIARLSTLDQVGFASCNPDLPGGGSEKSMLSPGLSVNDVQTAMAMTVEIAKLTMSDAVLSLKANGTMRLHSCALTHRSDMEFMPAAEAIEAIKDILQFVSRPSVKIDVPIEYIAAVASGRPCHDFLRDIFQKTCVNYINQNTTES